jgi:hypothetical protein
MTIYDCFIPQNGKAPVVCYECNLEESERLLSEILSQDRYSCFMSDGLYYVCQYVNERFKLNSINAHSVRFSSPDSIYIGGIQEAYGDRQYYYNRRVKQFETVFINIGD